MKMKPKAFTAEQLKAVKVESGNQTVENITPKSTDPENYPVFEVPVNSKVLIYVPNHTEVNEEGTEELRMDRPLIHTIIDGKRFRKLRCVRGLSDETGYSGNCPICDGESEPWDLANEQIKEQCRVRGLDVNDSENETVKNIKREYYSKRVVKAPDMYYTFPIVVLETDPADFKKILTDDSGVPKYKIYWYTISRSAYEKKWLKTLEGMEDEPNHPGGEFFILNYTYESKSGDYNKRDSARELQVVPKKLKGAEEFKATWDKETEGWDVIKAIETIYDNMYFEEEDLKAEVDKVLLSTREKLAIYASTSALPAGAGTGFQLGAPVTPSEEDESLSLPMADSIDE